VSEDRIVDGKISFNTFVSNIENETLCKKLAISVAFAKERDSKKNWAVDTYEVKFENVFLPNNSFMN